MIKNGHFIRFQNYLILQFIFLHKGLQCFHVGIVLADNWFEWQPISKWNTLFWHVNINGGVLTFHWTTFMGKWGAFTFECPLSERELWCYPSFLIFYSNKLLPAAQLNKRKPQRDQWWMRNWWEAWGWTDDTYSLRSIVKGDLVYLLYGERAVHGTILSWSFMIVLSSWINEPVNKWRYKGRNTCLDQWWAPWGIWNRSLD